MRHLKFGRRLNRDTKARKALLNNLAGSLFENGEITTTLTKAKFAKPYAEKLITLAKKDSLVTNRTLASIVSTKAFKELSANIGPGFRERTGGYTRIIQLNSRLGDGAKMAKLQLLKLEKKVEPKVIKEKTKHSKKKIIKKESKAKTTVKKTQKVTAKNKAKSKK